MNVLVCIPCLMTGGTEIQTLNLVKALITAEHKVTTVCYFEHSTNMVERYKQAGSNVCLLSPDGKRPVGITNTVILLYKGLHRVLREVKPDVVHVQYMAPGAIPIIILRLLGIKRIVATAHTAADIYLSLRLLHFVSRYILTAFQCITERAENSFFGNSQMYKAEMKLTRHGNHFTIYNNLPPYISIANKEQRIGKVITIGVVSRLEPIKGMDLVVPAFAKIHAMNPNTRLLVVGDGSLCPLMEQQKNDAGLNEVVKFAGVQPQEALQAYYDSIDILLMPSRSEGFGLTAIEGMARGCVVVAANTGGLPEVVSDGKVGLLHEPESSDSLAEKAIRLVNDRELLMTMKQNAIGHVARFSFAHYSALINNLYSNLLLWLLSLTQ